jgi:hypothetical protein
MSANSSANSGMPTSPIVVAASAAVETDVKRTSWMLKADWSVV